MNGKRETKDEHKALTCAIEAIASESKQATASV